MKRLYLFFCFVLLAVPVWADDVLNPEPLEQAIKEYEALLRADSPDPSNHEIWKLYVHGVPIQSSNGRRVPGMLTLGLLPDSADRYRVYILVNELYNFLRPMPHRGNVIVVEGRIVKKVHGEVHFHDSNTVVKTEYLYMYPENAISLPNEHFDPMAATPIVPQAQLSPTPTPGGSRH